jgi:hypothetical protein
MRKQGNRIRLGRASAAVIVMVLGATLPLASASGGAPVQKDPGRWTLVSTTSIRIFYYQGMTQDDQGDFYFDGIDNGLWKTNSSFVQTAGSTPYIPAAVTARDKYNHIGAIAYAKDTGVLLPMECYNGTNCANTGAIGVADPATLAWEYEVKLDAATIKKAMWAAVSPNGKLLWTSSNNNLLAYNMADISASHPWRNQARKNPEGRRARVWSRRRCVRSGSPLPGWHDRQRPPGVVHRHVERHTPT